MSAGGIQTDVLKRLFRRMGPHLKAHRRKLVLAFLAMFGVAFAEIMRPWPIKIIFDGILIPQENPDPVTAWLVGIFGSGDGLLAVTALAILGIALLSGAMGFAQAYLIAAVGQKVVAQIRLDLYRHIHRLSHSYHDTASSGDIIARLTGDVRLMRDLLMPRLLLAESVCLRSSICIQRWPNVPMQYHSKRDRKAVCPLSALHSITLTCHRFWMVVTCSYHLVR